MAEQKKETTKQAPKKEPAAKAAPKKDTATKEAPKAAPKKETATKAAPKTTTKAASGEAAQKKEPKKHNIVAAEGGAPVTHNIKDAAPTGNATGLRIGAVILWVAAIALEIIGILMFNGKVNITFIPTLAQLIGALVLDLICVIIGSQLWKKANHIDPASEKNKVKFWLWNNMGVIVCVVAFVPFIVLLLKNKDVDGKTKKVAAIVAVVALLIGGIASYDFNPISEEEKEAAMAEYGDDMVYWAPFGKVYHLYEDCSSLNQTDTLTQGTVEQAIAANRTRVCKHCENRAATEETVKSDIPDDSADTNIPDDSDDSTVEE